MPPPALDLEDYRRGVERLLGRSGAGEGEQAAELFSPEAVAGLTAAAGDARGDASRRLRALARFAAEGLLRDASAGEVAEIEARTRRPAVDAPGGPLTIAGVDAALAGEPDAQRRGEIHEARLRAIEALVAELVAEARSRREEAARGAGAPTPEALLAGAAGLELGGLAAAAGRLLADTDDAAGRALERAATRALGAPAAGVADLPRVVLGPHLEGELPPGSGPGAARRTIELLGLDAARAVPPGPGAPGVSGLLEVLRATGSALAAGGVSPRLPVEARLLPDPALRRGHRLLWEGLAEDPAWLARVPGLPDPTDAALTARAARLIGLRAAAARAAGLAGSTDPDAMSRAVGLPWPAALSLADPLAGLVPADELRGAGLASALRDHLREAFGSRWFTDPQAGRLLAELWLEGGALDPEDLARELGAPGLLP